ncbi:MAG: TIGR01777 family oxidoreductase, partial [Candidatus Eremiobacteraeota bacterium]|nr:TIGR01777 family oxidoreductase [Candidatus Eremiobacteraeota bacterium]
AFNGADAVIHLAGEPVGGRWTAEKKRAIYDSRILGTRTALASIAALTQKPETFICASGAGFYGSRGDEALDETSAAGTDFLSKVCVDWEREARTAKQLGLRSVQVRTAIALGSGGALAQMALPFKLGAGGPFGSGKQFVPWIHIDDLVEIYVFALRHSDLEGPINAVAPDYATNARFAQAIGAALHRPAVMPAPAFALSAVLGGFAETLLGSELVLPARLDDAGFRWKYPVLEDAANAVYPSASPWPVLQYYESEQFLASPQDDVFEFFSDAGNLESITPPSLNFTIRSKPRELHRGAQIAYDLRLHGMKVRWKTMIARWEPPYGFEDVQLHGPYALWHHEHRFEPVPGGVMMKDRVRYALPYYPFGNVALGLVRSDVDKIFAFRRAAIERRVAT